MKIERASIVTIAEAVLPEYDAYLVDVQIRGERGETLVQILADTDAGISIKACAVISKKIAARIEEEGRIEVRYRLEVSSPGLDRPLKTLRQYVTNTGRSVRVRYGTADEERSDEGVIKGVESETVLLERADGAIVRIAFESIHECRHQLPW